MKRLLIISPYFPPTNAADMQRVRMSLPYFHDLGYSVEVVAVYPKFSNMPVDILLNEAIPPFVTIHYVDALNAQFTSKIGLGSIALRSFQYYKKYVNGLLSRQKFDLIYFSTTQYPLCVLGAYWKKRFGVPYVIDVQDPWHTDYYQGKPKSQRPKKYWFSYRLNKWLEPRAMKNVDGLVSVSDTYIEDLRQRYPEIGNVPSATITFGAFAPDMDIAVKHAAEFPALLNPSYKNIMYIGRGGNDMQAALTKLFEGFKQGLQANHRLFSQLRLHFIGTSYAPNGQGIPTIQPLADSFGITEYVIEQTDRISYYHTLATLNLADGLFIPGSDSPGYTASKIYPYLLASKPLLAIFAEGSPALKVLNEYGVKDAYSFTEASAAAVMDFLRDVAAVKSAIRTYNGEAIEKYSAQNMAVLQCRLFDRVIKAGQNK
ncbi:glycosyltransferase [Mucilaginibacter ximonensis]|uniref:Glycosyltransferase n=1 Tax=Mucilaginibacter ximonensis TaxID=538021 RepID=A0ABW5YF53_9SPHI